MSENDQPEARTLAQIQADKAAAAAAKPRIKKRWIALGVFVAIGIIGAITDSGSQAKTAGSESHAAATTAGKPAATKAAPTNADLLQKAAGKVSHGLVESASSKNPTIDFRIDDNMTAGLRRAGVAMDTFKVLKALKDSGASFKTVTLNGTFDMKDAYGEVTKDENVYNITLDSATVQRINYDNVDNTSLDLLRTFSTTMWLHPAFGWNG